MDNFVQTFLNWDLISEVLPDLNVTGIRTRCCWRSARPWSASWWPCRWP